MNHDMTDPTLTFKVATDRDAEIKGTISAVYAALREKGYNPINQIVGYILSEDPTYITTHKGARSLISKLDRDDMLQAMVRAFIDDPDK
jgi:uncharacterized protein (UPF0297 family)